MSKWLNELCPIILDMLQDASLNNKREVNIILLLVENLGFKLFVRFIIKCLPLFLSTTTERNF